MLRKLLAFGVLLSVAGGLATLAQAQGQPGPQPMTLGERLQQLRRTLITFDDQGESDSHRGVSGSRVSGSGPSSSPGMNRSARPTRGTVPEQTSSMSAQTGRPVRMAQNSASASSTSRRSSRRTAQRQYNPAADESSNENLSRSAPKPLRPVGSSDTEDSQPSTQPRRPSRVADAAENPPRSTPPLPPRSGSTLGEARAPRIASRQYSVGRRQDDSSQDESDARGSSSLPSQPIRGSSPSSAPQSETLLVERSPSLLVETIGPSQIQVGKEALYRIRLVNEGRSAAHDVVVTVEIPAGNEIDGTKPSVGAVDTMESGTGSVELKWEIPRLDSRASEGMTIVFIPRESRAIDLGVHWTHAPGASHARIDVLEPKLELQLTGPQEVQYGEKANYRLTISNPGNGDAENVTVRLLPTTAGEAESAGHPLGDVAAGASRSVDLELIPRQSGVVVIRAEAVADGDLRATVGEEILVRRAELAVTIRGPEFQYAGAPATYEFDISNPGNSNAEAVEIAAILPPDAEYVSSDADGHLDEGKDQVLWRLSSLPPGAHQIVRLTTVLKQPGENRAQVTINAAGDLTVSGMTITEVEAVADLQLEVRDPRVPVKVGGVATYEVHVRNRGSRRAENVNLVAYFSEGVEPVAVEGKQHRIAPGEVAFDPIRSIEPGEEVVVKIQAVADASGSHIFRAEVQCDDLDASLAAEETTRFYQSTTSTRREPSRLTDADANSKSSRR